MKIICIGRNYVNHAKELNNPLPAEPLFFCKPASALLIRNRPFFYPDFSKNIHYETEIVVKICKVGRHIQEKFAGTYYQEIGIGLDLTARDLQDQCKKKGLPWEIAKAFDASAPVSPFIRLDSIGKNIQEVNFRLEKNGEPVQQGNTRDMIFTVNQLIAHVSRFMTLKTGDLLFTGTPAGVGPLQIGDELEAFIEDQKMLRCKIK